MTWGAAFTLAKKVPSAVYIVAFMVPTLGFAWNRHNAVEREKGRNEVLAAQLDSALTLAIPATAKAETVFVISRDSARTATNKARVIHDTIRVRLAALPDTVRITVSDVRTLVDSIITVDSVALAQTQRALANAEALAKAERAEKLLWQRKAETLAPTIVVESYKWRGRGEGVLVGAALATVGYLAYQGTH